MRLPSSLAPVALAWVGVVLFLLSAITQSASAANVLLNGGFESWSGNVPQDWAIQGGSAEQTTTGARTGMAARLQSPSTVSLAQFGEAKITGTRLAFAHLHELHQVVVKLQGELVASRLEIHGLEVNGVGFAHLQLLP